MPLEAISMAQLVNDYLPRKMFKTQCQGHSRLSCEGRFFLWVINELLRRLSMVRKRERERERESIIGQPSLPPMCTNQSRFPGIEVVVAAKKGKYPLPIVDEWWSPCTLGRQLSLSQTVCCTVPILIFKSVITPTAKTKIVKRFPACHICRMCGRIQKFGMASVKKKDIVLYVNV